MHLKNSISQLAHSYPKVDFHKLADKLLHYDVVSFDVFDTALKRRCGSPSSIFDIVERVSGTPNFKETRIEAERLARKTYGVHTNIRNIYQSYPASNTVSRELMNLELAVERENLIAYAPIHEIYKLLVNKGKQTLFISDMYLSEEFIRRSLIEAGYRDNPLILVSNERGAEKKSGKLFIRAKEQLHKLDQTRSPSMIHVGDSIRADYLGPRRAAISSCLIARYSKNATQ